MRNTVNNSEYEARLRLEAFWTGRPLDRPCLHVVARNPDYQPLPWPRQEMSPIERDLDAEYHCWQVDEGCRQRICLGEAMPCHQLIWGSCLVTLAVLAGGNYEYHDTAWMKELPDVYEKPLPAFDASHPTARKMEACYLALRETIGDRGFITPPLMCDALTTLSQLRTPDGLCMDLIERPEAVKGWTAAATTLYCDIFEHYYRLLGYGKSACFGGPVAAGRTEAVQCDFAVMLSPAMFAEFVMPDLRRTTEYFDRSLYHLDGTCQMRFLDQLASLPRLNGIQWNPEVSAACSPLSWLNAFRAIRERNLSLFVNCSVDDAVVLTRELGPDGLYILLPMFDSPQEGEAAIRKIELAA